MKPIHYLNDIIGDRACEMQWGIRTEIDEVSDTAVYTGLFKRMTLVDVYVFTELHSSDEVWDSMKETMRKEFGQSK